MRKSIKLVGVLMALFVLSLAFTGCNNGSSSGDDPAPAVMYTVSFSANGGSGTMYGVQVALGASYTVPACTFTAPGGKEFKCWNDGTADKNVGDTITVGGNITLTAQWKTAGMLSGVFSVSATDKVHFSKGNIYYDGSAFQFEAKQYDTASAWESSHVSHFFWSKKASVAYAGSYSGSGDITDVLFTNATETTPNSSFTVNGVTGKYRALTKDEWVYLFNTRTDAASKVGYGTVGEVKGFIILPDTFTDPMKNGGSGAFAPKSTTGWSANTYTTTGGSSSDWAAMEAAGAVFLPAGGYRGGSYFYSVGGGGYYWSATAYDACAAYNLGFSKSSVGPECSSDREFACAVRLVCVE